MIVWRNEFSIPGREQSAISADPPPGPIEITRVEERNGNYHVWFALVPARPVGGEAS